MTELKLSDQLGAMAIIDELYQQQQVILEHLDQATLRTNVAEKIKAYYQAKGLPIDEDIIHQGVKLWFDRRLRFSLPTTSWFQRFLGLCYIKRNYWVSALVAIVFFSSFTLDTIEHVRKTKRADLQDRVATQYQEKQQISQQLINIKKQYEQLSSQNVSYAKQAIETLKAAIDKALNNKQIQALSEPIVMPQVTSLKQGYQVERQLQQSNDALYKQLETLNQLITQWQQVIDANKRLQNVQGKVNQLRALRVPASDLKIVLSLQEAFKLKVADLDFASLHRYEEQLDYYVQLAKIPLRLKIVDRVGYKSGVERTYDNSGGKSWYLIVEATTVAGEVYPLWVKSNESGNTRKVNMFGVRVTKQVFDKVRQDKAVDGHIDNALVGKKAVGRLTFNYSRPIMDGTILEW